MGIEFTHHIQLVIKSKMTGQAEQSKGKKIGQEYGEVRQAVDLEKLNAYLKGESSSLKLDLR